LSTGSPSSTEAESSPKAPRPSSSASSPGGRITLRFADADALARAQLSLTAESVHPDSLSLDIAGRGDVATPRDLLDRLDTDRIRVEELALYTPDLDDVFLALTGQPRHTDDQPQEAPMSTVPPHERRFATSADSGLVDDAGPTSCAT
jgi:hypothetical protein